MILCIKVQRKEPSTCQKCLSQVLQSSCFTGVKHCLKYLLHTPPLGGVCNKCFKSVGSTCQNQVQKIL